MIHEYEYGSKEYWVQMYYEDCLDHDGEQVLWGVELEGGDAFRVRLPEILSDDYARDIVQALINDGHIDYRYDNRVVKVGLGNWRVGREAHAKLGGLHDILGNMCWMNSPAYEGESQQKLDRIKNDVERDYPELQDAVDKVDIEDRATISAFHDEVVRTITEYEKVYTATVCDAEERIPTPKWWDKRWTQARCISSRAR